MHVTLGKWEVRSDPSKPRGYQSNRLSPDGADAPDVDLEALAGDFITRHVLERDSVYFEG